MNGIQEVSGSIPLISTKNSGRNDFLHEIGHFSLLLIFLDFVLLHSHYTHKRDGVCHLSFVLLNDALIIPHEFISSCVFIAEKSRREVSVKLRVVAVEFFRNFIIIGVKHVHRDIEFYGVTVIFFLRQKIRSLLETPMRALAAVLIFKVARPIVRKLARHTGIHITRIAAFIIAVPCAVTHAWRSIAKADSARRVVLAAIVVTITVIVAARGITPVVVMLTPSAVAEFILRRIIAYTHYPISSTHVVAPPVVADIDVRLLLGEQHGFPIMRNVAPVALVARQVLYFVRVRTPQAVTAAQLRVVSGNVVVPVPIVNTTGADIVTVSGMLWARTMQYFSPLV